MKTHLLFLALAVVLFHLLRYVLCLVIICSTKIRFFFDTSDIDPSSFFPRFVPFVAPL